MPIIKINEKVTLRFFEPIETSHKDDRYVDTGVEIGENKHAIGIGCSSPLFSADGPEITGPIVDKFTKDQSKKTPTDTQSEGESEDPSPSEETGGDTSATPVTPEVLDSDEKTSVDSTTEPEAQTRVETEAERIQREGDEAMDDADDGTGHTYS